MALEFLELLPEPGAPCDQPAGGRIGHEAREREVQSEAGLVNEVIHVGFVPAVIIAAEKAATALVDKHPMGEMDRTDASDGSAGANVARDPVDPVNDRDLRPQPESPRLDRAHCGILIGHVVILAFAKLADVVSIIWLRDDRVVLL